MDLLAVRAGSPRGPVAGVEVTAFYSEDGEARTRMTALLADAVATLH